ncbi:hypothetical protein CCPUN_02910 [Cardinium endosymbiont of Culicoides punctatus]|nr:hypothetical protein CCPUN_02910 [Cardinium endosymbiont of Culicoides punctatus]
MGVIVTNCNLFYSTMKVTTQIYGQFLINSPDNYTGTYFSEIAAGLEHDSVWRHLNGSKLPSRAIWERIKQDIVYSKHGYLLLYPTFRTIFYTDLKIIKKLRFLVSNLGFYSNASIILFLLNNVIAPYKPKLMAQNAHRLGRKTVCQTQEIGTCCI